MKERKEEKMKEKRKKNRKKKWRERKSGCPRITSLITHLTQKQKTKGRQNERVRRQTGK